MSASARQTGGGVIKYEQQCLLVLEHALFAHNYAQFGAVLEGTGNSYWLFTDSRFEHNEAGAVGGVFIFEKSPGEKGLNKLTRCAMRHNKARFAAVGVLTYSYLVVEESTLADNWASNSGGVFDAGLATLKIRGTCMECLMTDVTENVCWKMPYALHVF